ncbi:hypothetical protein LVJ94_17250 [Pendulispora rubella]|uniref:Uncharacterized protein n=1 Tax=Pendulispora rubella TaxID=2741070 RepID=A0ABZ2LHD0_9BACT
MKFKFSIIALSVLSFSSALGTIAYAQEDEAGAIAPDGDDDSAVEEFGDNGSARVTVADKGYNFHLSECSRDGRAVTLEGQRGQTTLTVNGPSDLVTIAGGGLNLKGFIQTIAGGNKDFTLKVRESAGARRNFTVHAKCL